MAVTIKANASGNAGDLMKWNEDPGDNIQTASEGAFGYGSFSLVGNCQQRFSAGTKFVVTDSSDNNGEYTVYYTVCISIANAPHTSIRVFENISANSGANGKIKKHRVPDLAVHTDTADINGKTIVQGGAFAAAEIQDGIGTGKFVITGTIPAATTITAVALEAGTFTGCAGAGGSIGKQGGITA